MQSEAEENIPKVQKVRYPLGGIVTAIIYFLSMAWFLIAKTSAALKLWECMTVISALLILVLLIHFCDSVTALKTYRDLAVLFMACATTLTSLAHVVNITVTQKLMDAGIAVPAFWQIGQWPSVEMTVDYMAWGLFTGLAFVYAAIAVQNRQHCYLLIKRVLFINAILCLTGFAGAFCINENLWYVASIGYGPGFVIFCILWMRAEIKCVSKGKAADE